MNLLRVPSLQTALLFGQQIDTNSDMSVLVVDNWIVIELKRKSRYKAVPINVATSEPEQWHIVRAGARLLLMTLHLRTIWSQLVGRKLLENRDGLRKGLQYPGGITGTDDASIGQLLNLPSLFDKMPADLRPIYDRFSKISTSINDPFALTHLGEDVEEKFTALLKEFLSIDSLVLDPLDVYYQIDTIRAEDLPELFPVFDTLKKWIPGVDDSHTVEDGIFKAGLPITNYLTYGSVHYPHSILQPLPSEEVDECEGGAASEKLSPSIATKPLIIGERRAVRIVWECPYCYKAWMINEAEREEHLRQSCDKRPRREDGISSITKPIAANASNWKCDSCGEAFFMAPVERLKHRKACKAK
jgi:hypothetical protein